MSTENISITTSSAPDPVGAYPHARRAGNFLYLSGVGPRRPSSNEIPGLVLSPDGKILSYNFKEQCHSVFQNVRTILEASGSDWEELIDVTVFLTNMKQDFSEYNEIYRTYFVKNRPCRTTVEVLSLPTPIAIELKCIAYLADFKKT